MKNWSSILFTLIVLQKIKAQQLQTPPAAISLNEPIICDCGFEDENANVWSNVWYANYSSYQTRLQHDHFYQVMDFTVDAKYENTWNRVFSPHNVKLTGEGVRLTVKQQTPGVYTSASVGTKRSDFLYGTYRARIKVSDHPGTVAAFYFYHNDTSEIDMETLSRFTDPYQTYFAVKPQIYNEDGSASNLTNEKHSLLFNPTQEYHEYRFDWTPASVKFYIDGDFVREMTMNVPDQPGRVLINHWTDGNPHFSGAPIEDGGDADLHIAHMNMFFNTSDSPNQALACQKSKRPCKVEDIMNGNLLPNSEVHHSSAAMRYPRIWTSLIGAILCMLYSILF